MAEISKEYIRQFLSQISERDKAILLWFLIAFIACLFSKNLRRSLGSIFKAFLSWKIQVSYLSGLLWTALGVLILYVIHLWSFGQLKDTLIWALSIFPIILKAKDAQKNEFYYKDVIKENFKFILLFEYLIGQYTFSLTIELILMPFILIILVLSAYSKQNKTYERVTSLLNSCLSLIGVIIIIHLIYSLISTNFKDVQNFNVVRDLVVGIFLPIWFLPFIYVFCRVMVYEEGFINLESSIKKKSLIPVAKFIAIIRFNHDFSGFKRWVHMLLMIKQRPSNLRELNKSINEIKKQQKIEKNPPEISLNEGWSPYNAITFLEKYDLQTGNYQISYDHNWMACTPYKKLSNSILSNHISYYVEGTQTVAKELYISLNVNDLEQEQIAINSLIEAATTLLENSVHHQLPTTIGNAIKSKINFSIQFDNMVIVSIQKEAYLNKNTYSILFKITHI